VIVDDFDGMRLALLPDKADPPLVVDADRMLPGPVASQGLKPVARRRAQIIQPASRMQQKQLAADAALYRREMPNRPVVKQEFGILLRERSDHKREGYSA
jgi:hypothetical protein